MCVCTIHKYIYIPSLNVSSFTCLSISYYFFFDHLPWKRRSLLSRCTISTFFFSSLSARAASALPMFQTSSVTTENIGGRSVRTLLFVETSVSSRKARQEAWNNISRKHKCLSVKWMAVESTFVMSDFSFKVRVEFARALRLEISREINSIELRTRPVGGFKISRVRDLQGSFWT